jgi:SulP family sulfate permease
MEKGKGKVMLIYLSGPMVFGVSRAIAREQENIHAFESVVFDLSDVPLIDTTISLAIENAVKDAIDHSKKVYIACPATNTRQRFRRMGLTDLVGEANMLESRIDALTKAVS